MIEHNRGRPWACAATASSRTPDSRTSRRPVRTSSIEADVLETDGQPTDYDRYEGRHGVEDVRQAIREAKRDGVTCFALAVSKDRRPQLGQMFGHDRYTLLQRGSQLPDAMGDLLAELVRG